VREGGGERGIEPNKTSRGKRIAWGAQGQDMTINDKHDSTPPLTERLLALSRRNTGGNGGNHRSQTVHHVPRKNPTPLLRTVTENDKKGN